jgi:hypothetical protein
VLIHWKSLPEDLAAKGVEAVTGLPGPETAGGLATAFSADMIAWGNLQSRGDNFSNLVR